MRNSELGPSGPTLPSAAVARDIGASLCALGVGIVAPGRLFRSGKIDDGLITASCAARTIVGLRTRASRPPAGAAYHHLPLPRGCLKYDGEDPRVQRWIAAAIDLIDSATSFAPLLIHCAKGIDRTGMVVASVLGALTVPREAVIAEYALTPGADIARLKRFLDGIAANGFAAKLRLTRPWKFTA